MSQTGCPVACMWSEPPTVQRLWNQTGFGSAVRRRQVSTLQPDLNQIYDLLKQRKKCSPEEYSRSQRFIAQYSKCPGYNPKLLGLIQNLLITKNQQKLNNSQTQDNPDIEIITAFKAVVWATVREGRTSSQHKVNTGVLRSSSKETESTKKDHILELRQIVFSLKDILFG